MMRFIINPNLPAEETLDFTSKKIFIGSSKENDIVIPHESVAGHHCRIEEQDDGFHVVDISGRGIEIEGESIYKHGFLPEGSLLLIGDVTILFKGKPAEVIPATVNVDYERNTSLVPAGTHLPMENVSLQGDVFIQPAVMAPRTAPAGILSLLSLILSILGPVLFGIGILLWRILGNTPVFFYTVSLLMLMLGIIFGFISRATIRRRGGFLKDRQVSSWGLFLSFGWLMVIASIIAYHAYSDSSINRIAENEEKIQQTLLDIGATQAFIKHTILFDEDNDLIGEYADSRKFAIVKYSRAPKNISPAGIIHGYRLSFLNTGEDGFLVTAVPEKYKVTGRTSYYIDGEGHLRGEDIEGASPVDYIGKKKLPKLSQERSIYEIFRDELAGDIFEAARKEMDLGAKDSASRIHHYMRARRIAEELREYFPTSRITTELDSIVRLTEPVIIDFRAGEEYSKALALLDEGKPLHALETLKNAETAFPTSSSILEIRQLISQINQKHLQEIEAEARRIAEEAAKLELEGDLSGAYNKYKMVKDRYPQSSQARNMDPVMQKLQQKIAEKKAEDNIALMKSLSLEKDHERIASIIETLDRNSSGTQIYNANKNLIDDLRKKTKSFSLVAQAMKAFEEKDFKAALVLFHKAQEEFPDIQARIKEHLGECYLWVGRSAIEEMDYRTALDHFLLYRRLNPEKNRLPAEVLNRAYYEVGKLDYHQGNYTEAANKLFVIAGAYEKDPEFNYIYGSVLVERKLYQNAIAPLSISSEHAGFKEKSLRKRGYARIEHAFILEDKLRDVIIEAQEYQYLLDLNKIKQYKRGGGKGAQSEPEKISPDRIILASTNDETVSPSPNRKDEDSNFQRHFKSAYKVKAGFVKRNSNDPVEQVILAQAKSTTTAPPHPVERIISIIEEIEKSKDNLSKEESDALGDSRKREQISLKKARILEQFKARYASEKINLDKERNNKERILNGIKTIAANLSLGIDDVNGAVLLSSPNREVDEMLSMLRYKLQLYNGAYNNLLVAVQNENKLIENAIRNLEAALDQFSGWGRRIDISRNLQYAAMITPSKEALAKGLDSLTEALGIDADTTSILRAGGLEKH